MKAKELFVVAAVAVALAACGKKESTQQQESSTPVVAVALATEKEYTPQLTYTGTVFAAREANLGASLPGKVERILFTEGQHVSKGDLIVELSDEMLTQAQIEYETIKKDYERVSRLREKGSISEMEYDHIRAKYEASKAKTEMIRKNTQVHAPFSGVLVERMMEEGEVYFLNPGLEPGYSMRSGIVRLMQLDPVRIEFEVNEKQLSDVKVGQKVTVTLDAFVGESFVGSVKSIKPMLSTISRTATAEVSIANPNTRIKPGMYANVTVMLAPQKAVFVPIKSLYRVAGTAQDYLFTVTDGVANQVPVERIVTIADMVAVKGISANQQVIAEGKNRVTDGQAVTVKK